MWKLDIKQIVIKLQSTEPVRLVIEEETMRMHGSSWEVNMEYVLWCTECREDRNRRISWEGRGEGVEGGNEKRQLELRA